MLETRRFSLDDQIAFAKMSGDCNPMHVNPVQARRTVFGEPVVHGAHLVIWALETLQKRIDEVQSLRVKFKLPVKLDEELVLRVQTETENSSLIELSVKERVVCEITLNYSSEMRSEKKSEEPRFFNEEACKDVPRFFDTTSIKSASGEFPQFLDVSLAKSLAPLVWRVAPDLILSLASSSRLVGMECPGLHSLFSELKLSRTKIGIRSKNAPLSWTVRKFDARFSRAEITASTDIANMEIVAFLRPAPQMQPTSFEIVREVGLGNYAERRALVIGGSRGLGEVCAKILAAGGADVCLTYNQGKHEADEVVDEIVQSGGRAHAVSCDVLNLKNSALEEMIKNWSPTHLYYFATPPIFVASRTFSSSLFRTFCDFYVHGFVELLELVGQGEGITVFYPSSEAVDELVPDMAEYAAAKSAGEIVCRQLEKTKRDLTVNIVRLPRLPTDQTSTMFPVEAAEPIPLLLDVVNLG